MATRLERATATANLQSGPLWLRSVVLQGGSANSTVLIQDTTDGSGSNIFGLAALANDSAVWHSTDKNGVYFKAGLYATLAGTGAAVTVEYEQ